MNCDKCGSTLIEECNGLFRCARCGKGYIYSILKAFEIQNNAVRLFGEQSGSMRGVREDEKCKENN